MATQENSTNEFVPFPSYDGAEVFYTKQKPEHVDVVDLLNAKLEQLSAMTAIITGAGQESFSGYSDEIRHTYLYAIAAAVDEARQLAKLL